jgi:nitroreductase
MEYYDLIRNRESIRNYDRNRPLEREVLKRILEAGRLAPSACNLQPWKFLVVSSPEMLEKVGESYKRDWFLNAPHIVIVTGLKDQSWVRGYDGYNSIETDLAIAMTHIILAAENEGVGTCWIEAFDPSALRTALGLSENQVVYAMTPLGYQMEGFKKKGNKTRKPSQEVIEFI